MISRALIAAALASLVSSLALAQSPPLLPAQRTTLEVTPSGAVFVPERGLAPASGTVELTTPGLLWTRTDGGAAWIASAVSIGDRSGQVFAEYDLNNEAAELLSSFDTNPPTPVWTDGTPLGTEFRGVASADATNAHVAIDQVVLNNNIQTRQATLRKYTSSSPVPDWTYTFAPIINAGSAAGISRDGSTIVAAVMNNNTFQVEIAVFGPSSNVPVSYTPIVTGMNNYMRGFDLSADGSTLYFSAGVTAYVFDIATAAVVFSTNIGASFDSHAISGDGSVIAFGNFNTMNVWERSGATYFNTHTHTVAGQVYCAEIDISDDSSTIAYGWTFYNSYLTVRVDALDVATKVGTMTNTATGAGAAQNIVSDVSISADGSRFAVGLWGDASGLVPEVRVFSSSANNPIASLNTPGSVFDLDLSADGQRVVAGSKAVHANTFGNGGRVDLYDVGGEDLQLRGVPRLGATVNFDMHFAPGKNAFLFQALDEDPTPTTYPGIGTLYIDRATMTSTPAGVVPPSGIATKSLLIGTSPSLVGVPLYFQGFSVSPRQLSNDWIKMTILP